MVINLFKTLFVMLHVDYNTELLYFESGCLTLEQKMNFKTYALKRKYFTRGAILRKKKEKKVGISIKVNATKHIQQS